MKVKTIKIKYSSGWKLDIYGVIGCATVLVLATIMMGRPLWLFSLVVIPSGFLVANLSRNISRWIQGRLRRVPE